MESGIFANLLTRIQLVLEHWIALNVLAFTAIW